MQKPRAIVVVDMDGTLTHKNQSLYSLVESHGGLKKASITKAVELKRKYLAKALDGELNKQDQMDWVFEGIKLLIDNKISMEKIKEVLSRVRLRKYVPETLRFLNRENIPVAIVSYSITDFIEIVLRHRNIEHLISRVFATRLIIKGKEKIISDFSRKDMVLPNNKGHFSRVFADEFGVPHERILAVGDSGGDMNLGFLKENRIGIADNIAEKRKLEVFMGKVVVSQTFRPVKNWLKEKIESFS